MKLNARCMQCMIDVQAERLAGMEDEAEKTAYFRKALKLVAECGQDSTAPVVVRDLDRMYRETFGTLPDYSGIKKEYNRLMLELEAGIAEKIEAAEDGLEKALAYSRAGNYIDFASQHEVDREKLLALLDRAAEDRIEPEAYARFLADLEKAESLVFLLDNCGEIVLDKLVLEQLHRRFPGLRLTAFVRGVPVSNDVTMEDAEQVELFRVAEVVSNGSDVAGTDPASMSEEAVRLLRKADVILSKGQGNFESLGGCDLNVYYLFLIKCDRFEQLFGRPRHTGMFVRGKDFFSGC
jgi:uncharacterized protein with ATP-grasp and redox domains